MTIRCTAVYEKGILRPRQPITLPEGVEVEISVTLPHAASGPKNVAEVLAAIAAMPVEADDQSFSGSDHDKVLYGEHGAR